MKSLLCTLLIGFVLMTLLVTPAFADGPVNGKVIEEDPKAVVVDPQVVNEATAVGEASLTDEAVVASLGAEDQALSPEALNATTLYRWTNISRDASKVYSEGWCSASRSIYYMSVYNYLCRNGSCTGWHNNNGYNRNWLMAGWDWTSGAGYWETESYHYQKTCSSCSPYSIYTDVIVEF